MTDYFSFFVVFAVAFAVSLVFDFFLSDGETRQIVESLWRLKDAVLWSDKTDRLG